MLYTEMVHQYSVSYSNRNIGAWTSFVRRSHNLLKQDWKRRMVSSVTSSCYDDAIDEVANDDDKEEEDIYGPPPVNVVVAAPDSPDDLEW